MFFPQHTPKFVDLLALLRNKRVAVLAHMSPDGDSVGSQVALCRVLNAMGIESVCVLADLIPDTLKHFQSNTPIFTVNAFDPQGWTPINVDCADAERIGTNLRSQFPAPAWLNIDHHISNTNYGLHNIIDSSAAATAELMAGMFLDHKIQIDTQTAQALYLGLTTDTGNFLFNSTTARSLRIASELVSRGASPKNLCDELYQKEKLSKMHLLARFLQNLQIEADGKVCIGTLSTADYAATQSTQDASGGFVNYLRALEGVHVGVFIDIGHNSIKGSLRAKSSTLRLDLLAQHFGGGGHPAAAGFTVTTDFATFYPQLLKIIDQHLALYT